MSVDTGLTKQLFRDFLLGDAALRAAVDGQVIGGHLSSSDAQTVLQGKPIVVFEFVGGFARYMRELENVTIELYAYSKRGRDDCATVYDLAFARLQSARVAVTGIDLAGVARELDRPIDGFNEPIQAWFTRGRWTLIAV